MTKHNGPSEIIKVGGFFPHSYSTATRIRLGIGIYEKFTLVDLRNWYRKGNDPEFKPSYSGVALEIHRLEGGSYDVTVLTRIIDLLRRARKLAPNYKEDPNDPDSILKVGGIFLTDSRKTKIRVSINDYKSRKRLDLRIWYRDDVGEYKPSPKGISLDISGATPDTYYLKPITRTINLLIKAKNQLETLVW